MVYGDIFQDMDVVRRRVVLGFLGTRLDAGRGAERWQGWRPTVSLFQHEELLIDRLELFHGQKVGALVRQVGEDLAAIAPETEVRCHAIEPDDPWDLEQVYGVLHDFADDYPFDPEHEEYLLHITTGTHVVQICCFLLAESKHFPAKLVQTSPPRRGSPRGEYRIIDLDLSRYDQIARRFARRQLEGQSTLKAGIETRNPAFNQMIAEIEQVALRSRGPILLGGPTGAGKSWLARRIDELLRHRRLIEGRFVEVNCATLRGDGAMSALFGHRKGSFTGASRDREGLLRSADGGLLFLDEVGELGADEQAMLLRAIEEKRFLPLGGEQEVSSDFRLIAGTNRDLAEEVARGRFREDLLARIDLWHFELPGLAERREDIEPNLRFELDRYTESTGDRVTFNREAWRLFLDFATSPRASWRGNFRDLNAAVTRMATLAPGGRIGRPMVEREIRRLETMWSRRSTAASEAPPGADEEQALHHLLGVERLGQLDLFDRLQLAQVVRVCRCRGSLAEAGRELFAVSRQRKARANDSDRLRKYLARFGLDWVTIHAG